MVRLYTLDIRTLAPRYLTLLDEVDEERRARVLRHGQTDVGLRCLAAGLLLTWIVSAGRMGVTPAYLQKGKPYIDGACEFNLSHAGDFVVLATAERAVGVDIERERPMAYRAVAERFFHPEEADFLRASQNPLADFFTLWTLKESYLKAEGSGLSRPLRSFKVLPDGSGATPGWSTPFHFHRYAAPAPGYQLAVCSLDGTFCDTIETVNV